MEPTITIIIILVITITIGIERIFKHCKKSKCCGNSEIEFDQSTSAPDFGQIPILKK